MQRLDQERDSVDLLEEIRIIDFECECQETNSDQNAI